MKMGHILIITCPSCGHEYEAETPWLVCPNCGHETDEDELTMQEIF